MLRSGTWSLRELPDVGLMREWHAQCPKGSIRRTAPRWPGSPLSVQGSSGLTGPIEMNTRYIQRKRQHKQRIFCEACRSCGICGDKFHTTSTAVNLTRTRDLGTDRTCRANFLCLYNFWQVANHAEPDNEMEGTAPALIVGAGNASHMMRGPFVCRTDGRAITHLP